ncbi:clavesin-1 [Folsomia candida]|uniref:clavesin-1 n=1 Tax=Folsomia candida TaxID=158441 RepID=UPI000B90341A|nr:clavesin-1 [Folsomia candida]
MTPDKKLVNIKDVDTSEEDLDFETQCLVQLKNTIKRSNDPLLLTVLDNDAFLNAFLVGRKFNVCRTFETVKGYLITKHVKQTKIFRMKPHSVRHVLESGFIGLLKNRDHLGRVIGFVRCTKLDLKTMECADIARAVILLGESLWENVDDMMRNGQVGILDYSGYNFSVMTRYSFSDKLTFLNIFLHNYPMMIKNVHGINNPRIVQYALSLLRPFIPKKIKDRFLMHGSNYSGLHEHISPKILPTWLGGELSDEDAIDTKLIQRIITQDDGS